MRLLNTSTYQLESFLGTEKPPYAILSHTWEPEGEILFNDLLLPLDQLASKIGFLKVKNTCSRAAQDGYSYVWIDTLCIDKSSSAELSEAINSMFRWYKESAVCYAFLADVYLECSMPSSRWFTRGWTLQELIAPDEVLFYDMNWCFLGSRRDLASFITSVTKIPKHVLDRPRYQRVEAVMQGTSVAQRMIWASARVTTREEDIAYCLMGIFDVNMPLLYGEGQKAFIRLQEAIIHASEDQTILAFRHSEPLGPSKMFIGGASPTLAPDPSYFCDDIRRDWTGPRSIRLDNGDVTLEVFLINITRSANLYSRRELKPTHVALLDCVCGDEPLSRPGLLLQAINSENTQFQRCLYDSRAVIVKATPDSRQVLRLIGHKFVSAIYFRKYARYMTSILVLTRIHQKNKLISRRISNES